MGNNRFKSECMRFVHSRGNLDSLRRRDSLDRSGDLGCIVKLEQFVEPRSVLAKVPLDIADHITQALPFMLSRALIVHVATGSFNGICPGTISRQPQPCKAGMALDPLLHGLSSMNTAVIHDHSEAGDP